MIFGYDTRPVIFSIEQPRRKILVILTNFLLSLNEYFKEAEADQTKVSSIKWFEVCPVNMLFLTMV